jgi:hypothetical protein
MEKKIAVKEEEKEEEEKTITHKNTSAPQTVFVCCILYNIYIYIYVYCDKSVCLHKTKES